MRESKRKPGFENLKRINFIKQVEGIKVEILKNAHQAGSFDFYETNLRALDENAAILFEERERE